PVPERILRKRANAFPSRWCATDRARHPDNREQIVVLACSSLQDSLTIMTPCQARRLRIAATLSALAPGGTLPCPGKPTRHRQSPCKTFLPFRAAPELRGRCPAVRRARDAMSLCRRSRAPEFLDRCRPTIRCCDFLRKIPRGSPAADSGAATCNRYSARS